MAHFHGQVWNASELARSLDADYKTAQRYLDVLASTFMIRVLRPFHANIKKRQVKSPKVFVRDSGLLHALLDLPTRRDLDSHPKVGASWEGFMLGQVCSVLNVSADRAYFWSTHAGPEVDLIVEQGRKLHGFEFKRTVSPSVTKSMHAAFDELDLASMTVVHAGSETFTLRRGFRAVAATRIAIDLSRKASRG